MSRRMAKRYVGIHTKAFTLRLTPYQLKRVREAAFELQLSSAAFLRRLISISLRAPDFFTKKDVE